MGADREMGTAASAAGASAASTLRVSKLSHDCLCKMESLMLALYHNDMSLCAQKVRVCLSEKQLPCDDRDIVLRSGEHQKPCYVKLNRSAVVATLMEGDKLITESNVIIEYLDEAYPEPPLAPQDPYGRAKMR